jgi:hypothetical protein
MKTDANLMLDDRIAPGGPIWQCKTLVHTAGIMRAACCACLGRLNKHAARYAGSSINGPKGWVRSMRGSVAAPLANPRSRGLCSCLAFKAHDMPELPRLFHEKLLCILSPCAACLLRHQHASELKSPSSQRRQ